MEGWRPWPSLSLSLSLPLLTPIARASADPKKAPRLNDWLEAIPRSRTQLWVGPEGERTETRDDSDSMHANVTDECVSRYPSRSSLSIFARPLAWASGEDEEAGWRARRERREESKDGEAGVPVSCCRTGEEKTHPRCWATSPSGDDLSTLDAGTPRSGIPNGLG
ncbi:hypothetical protein B0T24DRAFT_589002 [Lasiosphaeria ovina]|uniref:Secreted protein n=1 Tax=Lasiosphaeria ovina TaxID=92902 RepID=A0AAE0NMS8_9PEZI|nr:hypothetical protein B0T24DRAFT_589002 [Lasiosphaeria ovina]